MPELDYRFCATEAEREKYREVVTAAGTEGHAQWLLAKLTVQCKRDFAFFCRRILGYADMNAEHDALCEFLQQSPARVKLILMPRYTFKSSIVTIGQSLWRLLNDPNERILLCSDAAEKAEGFLLGIKNHILGLTGQEGFRRLTAAQPWEVDPQRHAWNQSAIVIAARTQAQVEPSIDTAGLETSKVGMHYSRIVFDDLVTDKNVTTKELMDKVEECYKKSLSLLQPSGSVDLCGTRWHFGDLYGRLLAEYRGRRDFALFHRRAVEGSGARTRYVFQDIGKDSLTPEFLANKKATQGTRLFSALYQNEPTDDETATFKAADFRFYPAQPARWRETLYVTGVLDAIPPPTSDHGDDAAITVVGTDRTHTLFLLDAVAGRFTPDRQLDEVLRLHAQWGFRKFGLETNAFQRVLKTELERRLMTLRGSQGWTPLTIVEFQGVTQGNKEQRIQGLQPWHERGLLRFPGERLESLTGVWSALAWQMLEFPHSRKDDLLDSLAYHLQLKQVGFDQPQQAEYPVTSAAWFEREQWKQMQARWRRPWQPLPELAFS